MLHSGLIENNGIMGAKHRKQERLISEEGKKIYLPLNFRLR